MDGFQRQVIINVADRKQPEVGSTASKTLNQQLSSSRRVYSCSIFMVDMENTGSGFFV